VLPAILQRVEAKGYRVFTGNLNVNIVGVRSVERVADAFDDWLHLVYQSAGGRWVEHRWPITTDPGKDYLLEPMNALGTAFMAPGQYRGAYRLGLHRGQYEALVQAAPVTVYRQKTTTPEPDGTVRYAPTVGPFTGFYGLNIHRSSARGESARVGKWSAGCQVFKRLADYNAFMGIVKQSMEQYGDRVTYTLVGD
jgi:hypothetical protein